MLKWVVSCDHMYQCANSRHNKIIKQELTHNQTSLGLPNSHTLSTADLGNIAKLGPAPSVGQARIPQR
jgi:hypothetical protein